MVDRRDLDSSQGTLIGRRPLSRQVEGKPVASFMIHDQRALTSTNRLVHTVNEPESELLHVALVVPVVVTTEQTDLHRWERSDCIHFDNSIKSCRRLSWTSRNSSRSRMTRPLRPSCMTPPRNACTAWSRRLHRTPFRRLCISHVRLLAGMSGQQSCAQV